jgi:hypothetical protein
MKNKFITGLLAALVLLVACKNNGTDNKAAKDSSNLATTRYR